MLSSSPGIQSPQVTAACGSWPGWSWHGPRATGQIVVLLPSPHVAHLCQSASAGGGAMVLWTLHLYLGLMEFLWNWYLPGRGLPVLQAEPPGPCLLSPDSRLAQAG